MIDVKSCRTMICCDEKQAKHARQVHAGESADGKYNLLPEVARRRHTDAAFRVLWSFKFQEKTIGASDPKPDLALTVKTHIQVFEYAPSNIGTGRFCFETIRAYGGFGVCKETVPCGVGTSVGWRPSINL